MNETLAAPHQESPLEKALQAGRKRKTRIGNAFKRFRARGREFSGQAVNFVLGAPELVSEGAKSIAGSAREKVSGLKDTIVKKTGSFIEKVSGITTQTKEKVTHSCQKLASKFSEVKETAGTAINKTKDNLSRWGLSHLVEPTKKRVAQICAIPEGVKTWATEKNIESVKDPIKAQERAEKLEAVRKRIGELVEAKGLIRAIFAKIKENWQKGAEIEERLRAFKAAQQDYYSMFLPV